MATNSEALDASRCRSRGDARHTPPKEPDSVRYHYLDALRGFLMIWGILVHTSTLGYSPFFTNAARFSGWVRMEAFFIISGFFSLLIFHRYGGKETIRKRALTVGVPFITCVILLNPFTNYLIYNFHNPSIPLFEYLRTGGASDAQGPMVWTLHLWFLVVLIIYGVLTPTFSKFVDRVIGLLNFDETRKSNDFLIFTLMCGFVGLGSLFARASSELVFEPLMPDEFQFLVRSTLHYLPCFLLGMCLFGSPRLLRVFSRLHPVHLGASALFLYLAKSHFEHLPKLAAESLHLVADSVWSLSLSSALFCLFQNYLPVKSHVARYFSDAAYSVYLFHFFVIYLLATALRPLLGKSQPLLWIVAFLTLFMTLFIHQFIILRFPALRFIFNGRVPNKKANFIVYNQFGEVSGSFVKPE